MTATIPRPTRSEPGRRTRNGTEPKSMRLPKWLSAPPRRTLVRRPPPGPRDVRWWVGVVWFTVAALALGLVAHVTVVGALQHARSQFLLYQELRTDIAEAVTPLGQLGVDETLVPNGTPIAVMEIPKLQLREVIVQGTTSADLAEGPGHRRDTVYPGQQGTSVIMGRQATYGGPFGGLARLIPGDTITVTTGQGEQEFEVFGIRRDGDLLPAPLADDEGRIELITADGIPLAPGGSLHIDAELTSDLQETPSPVFTEAVLDPAERAMASDSSSLFPTVFWFQWLVIAAIGLRWARARWGRWQTWIVAVPLLLGLGAATADSAIGLLANLL